MPSRQARFFNALISKVIRRENWGGARSLTLKARLLFGTPALYQWLAMYGVRRVANTDANVRGEWLTPKKSLRPGVILYVHGGGYVSCSAATHRPITAALARLTQRKVFSVDYRRAPEARFPAAIDDVIAAYHMVLAGLSPHEPVAIVGDSAGGGLALALAMHARDAGLTPPTCVVAFSPWTDLEGTGESLQTNNGKCVMFRPGNISQFAKVYLGDASPRNPKASPLFGSASNLPPILFQVGATELLLDDSVRFHKKILQAGGASELVILDDGFHGIQVLTPVVPEAKQAAAEAAEFIERQMVPERP